MDSARKVETRAELTTGGAVAPTATRSPPMPYQHGFANPARVVSIIRREVWRVRRECPPRTARWVSLYVQAVVSTDIKRLNRQACRSS